MRKLPGENVTIVKNKEEKTINVQSDKSDFQLLLMNEDDYPNTKILDTYSLEFLDLPNEFSEKD
jgi:DNA polymerase III sliding clamp (beta) subunit (PCNA family)